MQQAICFATLVVCACAGNSAEIRRLANDLRSSEIGGHPGTGNFRPGNKGFQDIYGSGNPGIVTKRFDSGSKDVFAGGRNIAPKKGISGLGDYSGGNIGGGLKGDAYGIGGAGHFDGRGSFGSKRGIVGGGYDSGPFESSALVLGKDDLYQGSGGLPGTGYGKGISSGLGSSKFSGGAYGYNSGGLTGGAYGSGLQGGAYGSGLQGGFKGQGVGFGVSKGALGGGGFGKGSYGDQRLDGVLGDKLGGQNIYGDGFGGQNLGKSYGITGGSYGEGYIGGGGKGISFSTGQKSIGGLGKGSVGYDNVYGGSKLSGRSTGLGGKGGFGTGYGDSISGIAAYGGKGGSPNIAKSGFSSSGSVTNYGEGRLLDGRRGGFKGDIGVGGGYIGDGIGKGQLNVGGGYGLGDSYGRGGFSKGQGIVGDGNFKGVGGGSGKGFGTGGGFDGGKFGGRYGGGYGGRFDDRSIDKDIFDNGGGFGKRDGIYGGGKDFY